MPRLTASRCRADSPLMCKGRAEAQSPGVWLDPDSLTWLWSDGSGSTGVAAYSLGRDYIGVEMDPVWVDASRRRIADAAAQGSLFS